MQANIKKKIWAKPQTLRFRPAAGLIQAAASELQDILNRPIYQAKFNPELNEQDGWLTLSSVDFRSFYELLYRSCCSRDLQWLLIDRHVGSFAEFTTAISKFPWALIIEAGTYCELSADARRSKLYHERKLQDLAAEALQAQGYQVGGHPSEGRVIRLHFEQTQNRLQVFVSLAGEDLYRRGFKCELRASATLREDIAASLLRTELVAEDGQALPSIDTLWLPFAGSGTFGFEFLQRSITPPLAAWFRTYSLQSLVCHNEATDRFVKSRLSDISPAVGDGFWGVSSGRLQFVYEERQASLLANIEAVHGRLQSIDGKISHKDILYLFQNVDSLATDTQNHWQDRHILMLSNPPYGLRLGQDARSSREFYRLLSGRINAISSQAASLRGMVLLADDGAYKGFISQLNGKVLKVQSFNQGGLHTRAVYFQC